MRLCCQMKWSPARRKPGVADAENKYQDVKAGINALGPVNPLALEEFQVASEKYDFLNTQRQDLLDCIRDTEKAIQDRRRIAQVLCRCV